MPQTNEEMLALVRQIPERESGMDGLASRAGSGHHTAMYLDTTVVAGRINDPDKSQVVGKGRLGHAAMGTAHASQTGGFGINGPAKAENKDAACLLMQCLTSKEGDKLVPLTGVTPSHFSTLAEADVNAGFPHLAKCSGTHIRTRVRLS